MACDNAVVRAAADRAATVAASLPPRAARAAAQAELAAIDVPRTLGGTEATFRDIMEKFVRPFAASSVSVAPRLGSSPPSERASAIHAEQFEACTARMLREVRGGSSQRHGRERRAHNSVTD